jgi:hypothetical protein
VAFDFEEEFLSNFHNILKHAIDFELNVFYKGISIGQMLLELGGDEIEEIFPHGVDFGVALFFREELFETEYGGFVKPGQSVVPAVNKFQSFDFEIFFQIEDVVFTVPLEDFDGAKIRVELLVFEFELIF